MHNTLFHPSTIINTHKRCKSYPDQLVSLKISEEITVELYEKDFISQGRVSNVYLGRILGEQVAIKIPHSDQDSIDSVQREYTILKSLPKSLAWYFLHCTLNSCLVFKFAEWDVYSYFKKHITNPHLALNLISQLFQQIEILHSEGIYHGDIKPHNLLLYKTESNPMDLKIVDYGQAINFNLDNLGPLVDDFNVGTTAYTPPEAFKTQLPNDRELFFKRDIYGAGITSFFIATGMLPFRASDSPVKLIVAIRQGFIECGDNSIPGEIYSQAKPFYDKLLHLLAKCTNKDPLKRPSATEINENLNEIKFIN
jgi:serine/threonine protein kinase